MSNISDLDELIQIVNQQIAVIVYFYNDDCPPCISLRPKVENLITHTFPKMKLIWVNSKKHPELPANYNVFANPTILVFFEGKEFRRFSKYISISELEQVIDRYYKLLF